MKIEYLDLYEILVPTVRNDGRPIHLRFHKVWDKKVQEITGGLSILPPIKGNWIEPNTNTLFSERMIPVRIAVDSQYKMLKIAEMTAKYYEQKAVMYYKVSDSVTIIHVEESNTNG